MTAPIAGVRHARALNGLALALGAVVVVSVIWLIAAMVGGILGGDLVDAPIFLVFVLIPASLGSVGALLALRRSENLIGWLLLLSGALAGIAFASAQYVRAAAETGHLDWPMIVPAGWISNTWFVPAVGLLVVYLPLLFPTGRLPGPRWRIISAIGAAGILTGALGPATAPITLEEPVVVANPLAPGEPLLGAIQLLTTVSNVIAPVIFLAAVSSLLIRFRRSRGVERQQLKWFLFVAAFVAAAFALSLVSPPPVSDVAWFVGLVSMALLPAAIAVAILRYRLYDIDRIISRTISYAIVTALLALVFGGTVLVLQAALASVTHSTDTLTVAGSTLLVAALFQPVRRRVQATVDGRFNRRRYDAEREVEAFVADARDEVEIDRLAHALAATLVRTVEPASASVWLRSGSTR
jgi:hypothetical protein